MSIDLHHNEDEYRKAYHRLEEEPSAQVWDKVTAALDGRDAKYYQQKSLRWKRISILLLLLLGTVVISGILYVSNSKSEGQQTGTNSNDEKRATDKMVFNQPLPGDSNATTQNINKKEIYAAAKPTQSYSDTTLSAIRPTAPEQMDEIPEQDYAVNRKQHSKQVQNTSVMQPASATRQQAATETNAAFSNKKTNSASLKKKDTLINKEANTYAQNVSLNKHRNIVSRTALERNNTYNRNNKIDVYEPDDDESERIIFTPLAASGLRSFTNNVANKETVDTLVTMQLNAVSANALQHFRSDDTATASADQKSIRIAKIFKPRLQLTGYSSLDFTQYHLDNDEHGNNNNPPRHREDKHDFKERESLGFSFTAGLVARVLVTPKISLKTGVNYSNTTINIQPQTLYADKDENQRIAYKFTTSSGYGYVKSSNNIPLTIGDSTKANFSHQQLQYLSIPFMFGYTVYTGRRFTITPSFGAAANILLSTKVNTEINNASTKEPVVITKLNGLKSWYPSLMADAELQYHFTRKWSITLLPSLRYAIRPITQNNSVKTVPYNFGLGAGFTYHL